MGYEVYKALRTNDRILELWSRTSSSGGIVPDDALAAALDVDRIIVGAASSNTAANGLTESKSFIWGKFCLFAHIVQSPTPYTPQSCVQRFRFRGAGDPRSAATTFPVRTKSRSTRSTASSSRCRLRPWATSGPRSSPSQP